MSRSWSAAAVAVIVAMSLVGPPAVADTARVKDPRNPIGRHDIRSLTVDNTGPRVGARVVHRGARWTGKVRLAFNTAGGRRPEYVAQIRHSRPSKATFRKGNGRVWRCAARAASSRPGRRLTVLSAPRACLGGATRMTVRVKVTSPRRRSDSVASRTILQQVRPNVVMIMVDDMRKDDLRYMPRTRRYLGGRGVTFANSLAPYPLCCPARASVLLGQYSHNHRVWSHKAPWGFPSLDDRSTVATWLRSSGYATVYLGKYLNGYGARPAPGKTTGNSVRYVPPGWSDWRASIDGGLRSNHPKSGGTYRYFQTTLSDNGRRFDNYGGRYQSRVYGELSEEIVESRAASDRPFFFYASYTAPHHGPPREADDPGPVVRDDGKTIRFVTPAVPGDVRGSFNRVILAAPGASWRDPDLGVDKPEYLNRLRMNAAERRALLEATRQRAEALSVVDVQVKRTVDALARTGELERTLIMFTADNGYFLGEQNIRQGKILPYDPALRTPLLMRGPGIPAGEVRYDPFLSTDFAPTIADLAGVRPRVVVDGTSMLGVARYGDRGWTRPVLTETGSRGVVRETDESGEPLDPETGEADYRYVIGVRTDRYLYTHVATGEEELYDLSSDPRQYHNLVERPDYSTVLDQLRAQLRRVRACDGAECRVRLPAGLATGPGGSILDPANR